jgi:hydroxymethylglutaryl-CoA reductase
LATQQFSGEEVRARIVTASEIAFVDPYRAATHNKGIMNGVDAVAIATGNDWRAIEAGAHAYAALSGQYRPLARWSVAADGGLHGELSMPLRMATVGGTLDVNSAARMALNMIAAETSQELAQLTAAVGLAQNFAAIKALATSGIQEGHMRMHARSAVRAEDYGMNLDLHAEPHGSAAGKVILLGEHAAVYGKHAVALPIPAAVTAKVTALDSGESKFISGLLKVLRRELEIEGDNFGVDVRGMLPPGMGLGASAAIAVAMIRAVDTSRKLGLGDDDVNRVAFECEKISHGNPSGVDNAIATFAEPMLFNNESGLSIERLQLPESPPLLIAFSGQRGSTRDEVAGVRMRYDAHKSHYAAVFDQIDALSIAAAKALIVGDYLELGALMNVCHGLLNAIEVSTPELESMVGIARAAGATGAKLTGGGGGGSVVALCPGTLKDVQKAYSTAGFETLLLTPTEKA